MNMQQQTIEDRLERIESRNHRVELDKAWESSWVRRIFIAVVTYLVFGLYLRTIGISRPWLNSIVPALGFLISTVSIVWLKQEWIKRRE